MKKVNVILYPDFTALDVFGAVEVLGNIKEYEIHYCSEDGGIIRNKQGLQLYTENMSSIESNGILLIPGGYGSRSEVNNQKFLALLSQAIDKSESVLCVCTGSALAAKTGLLNGLHATSNKTAFDWVCSCGEYVNWNRKARWVADGKFYTSAGVSAGIDMAIGFVKDKFGLEIAEQICRKMEYHWNSDSESDIFC